MCEERKLLQKHNQILLDEYNEYGPVILGPYSSYTWRHDPMHVLFTLARYKFCAKMLAGSKDVLEIGCGDAVGSPLLLQTVERLHAIDLEPLIIENNIRLNAYPDRLSFEVLDVTRNSLSRKFDAGLSLDVIEHIPKSEEHNYLENICRSLKAQAVFILGTPNITAKQYASPSSAEGHINLKSHETLRSLLDQYFHNVLLFSMNDEVVHTGFYPMCHYLMALACGKRDTGLE